MERLRLRAAGVLFFRVLCYVIGLLCDRPSRHALIWEDMANWPVNNSPHHAYYLLTFRGWLRLERPFHQNNLQTAGFTGQGTAGLTPPSKARANVAMVLRVR